MTNKFVKAALIYFVLPLAVILIAFNRGTLYGFIAITAVVSFLLFKARSRIFSFIGGVHYSKGNLEEAARWFKKAYLDGKARPRTVVSYAYILLKSGQVEKAEQILNALLGRNLEQDDRMYAKSNLALVLWKKGDLDAAVEMLEEVIAVFKTSTVYGSLGYLLILKGDLDKALSFNLEAYDYNDTNTVILDNVGQTHYLRGDYDKAVEIYEKLMQQNPTFPEAYYNYGLALSKKGETAKALETMKKALDYKLSFLSTVTREEIETAIKNLSV